LHSRKKWDIYTVDISKFSPKFDVITSTDMTTTEQILKILHSHPFSRFSMSKLKPHLSPTTLSSDQEIHNAMVELFQGGERGVIAEGDHRADGNVAVRWVSYYGD